MNTKICPQCQSPIPENAPGGFCPVCVLREANESAPAGNDAPPIEAIQAAFPQLEIVKLLGRGGMGFVYEARQPSLDRTVALKILAPGLSRDPAFAERFAREARVLGKLSHPNIVKIHEHGESGGYFYLMMEHVEGVNLREAMRAGRFTPAQALAMVPGLCDALQAAHAQGVWHRDIKPENILLDLRGGLKIVDFGVARIVGDPARDFTLTATGGVLGSAAYMAPEQHEKPHDVDHRADIYSLGVVIYEMLTGELPLGRFPNPSDRAEVNALIDEVILRTLQKQRELRQQSADEVKTDVQTAERAGAGSRVLKDGQGAPASPAIKYVLIGSVLLFLFSTVFTHGSSQGILLAISTTAFVGGLIALVLGRGAPRGRQVQGPPAPITVRSLALFFGGLVALGAGMWIYNGGLISMVVSGVRHMADDVGLPVANRPTALTVGSLTIAAGVVSTVLGYAGIWYALWQIKRGFIASGARGMLRFAAILPPALLAAVVCIHAARSQALNAARSVAAQRHAAIEAVKIAEAKRSQIALEKEVANEEALETWRYTPRHLTSAKLAEWKERPDIRDVWWSEKVSAMYADGEITLSGPASRVRPLMTILRCIDQAGPISIADLPGLNDEPDIFTRNIMAKMLTLKEYDQSPLDPKLIASLRGDGVEASQLARALGAHVLEIDKATYVNSGTPFESIIRSPGASAYYEASIPCADRPEKPLTMRIRRTVQQMGTQSRFSEVAPWLREEAKEQKPAAEPKR